ncbi:MAG TPA: hypothetical protein VFO95_04565 [Gemmatimonadales bacterium]|nr:hypothetical protein [Gemmatimonadales bacterium]
MVVLTVAVTVLLSHRQLLEPVALTTRDHADAYLRVHQYHQELSRGHWPQNFPDAVRGGGHAFPRFYPPLSQTSAVGLYYLTGDVVSATHLSGLLAIVLAGVFCFLVLRSITGAVLPAVLGAILYATFPYQFIALDVRGAFAETWALAFYPLVLAGLVTSLRRGSPTWWLPLAVAGALASHLVMSAWALPSLLIIALFTAAPGLTIAGLLRTGLGGVLGAAIVAPWILPTLMEVSGLRAADPQVIWATPQAITSVRWEFYEPVFRVFPYWKELVALLLGIGVTGLWRSRRDPDLRNRLCWSSLVVATLLMGLAAAPEPVWRLVPQPLRYIQFPQRLDGIASFLLVVALAVAVSWLTGYRRMMVGLPTAALMILHAIRLGGQILPRSGETGSTILTRLATDYPDRGLTVVGEYLPRDAEPEQLAAAIQATLDRTGEAPLLSWTRIGGEYEATVSLDRADEVSLPLVAYSFHRVRSDAGSVPTTSRDGQLTVRLEAGTHILRIERQWPVSLRIGVVLALVSLAVWMGLLVKELGAREGAESEKSVPATLPADA